LAGVTATQEAAALMRTPDAANEIVEALGDAGFGPSRRTAVDTVMNRLLAAAGDGSESEAAAVQPAKFIGQDVQVLGE
jgi:hypothetical protein